VFGKWSRPNYNSVVATFCHNIIYEKPNKIDDPSAILQLLYIDDLIEKFCELINSDTAEWPKNIIIENFPTHTINVGDLHKLIAMFHEARCRLHVSNVGLGLERALYATYLSYLPSEKFEYSVPKYSDARGDFVEMLKTPGAGQVSYFTAEPGVVRGGHYHHSKSEKFLVVQGRAAFRFKQIANNEKYEILINSAEAKIVETIPGWAHQIENIGVERLIVLVWANEVFDHDKPDTFNFSLLDKES
jgi:UDP-2-acetamido-2,6-beta-L-arabino-hexul-4-ose reductase